MSELINNLNTIYNAKLAIKQAIGTESDNLLDYASYISAMAPQGTSYLTTNGLYDISTYAYVDVDVQGGGGVDYQLVDLSYTMTVGEKYEFNGLLGINGQITSEWAQTYPVFEPYIGSYICGIVGDDHTTSDNYGKGAIFENEPVSLNQKGVVARGTFIGTYDIGGNTDLVVIDDCIEAKYAGGNGTKNITSNGTQQVVGYQSVSVNVTPQRNHDGLTEATAFTVDEAIEFINTLTENVPTSNMYYVKGRISQVIYTLSHQYPTWRGYISDDGIMYNDQSAPDSVDHSKELFIYTNGYGVDYQTVNWNGDVNPQVKVGDSVVVYANLQLWTDSKISRKPQTNNGYLANHQRAVNGSPVNPITTNGVVVDVQDYVSVTVNVVPTYNIIDSLPESDNGWYFQLKEIDGYNVPTGNVKYLLITYNCSGYPVSYNYNFDEIFTATGFSDGNSLGVNLFYNGHGGVPFGFENYVGSDSSDYMNPLAFTGGETDVLRTAGGFYYGLGGNFDISDAQIFIWNTKVSTY